MILVKSFLFLKLQSIVVFWFSPAWLQIKPHSYSGNYIDPSHKFSIRLVSIILNMQLGLTLWWTPVFSDTSLVFPLKNHMPSLYKWKAWILFSLLIKIIETTFLVHRVCITIFVWKTSPYLPLAKYSIWVECLNMNLKHKQHFLCSRNFSPLSLVAHIIDRYLNQIPW